MHASKSKWFVGSSRSKRSGLTKSAPANAVRTRQPPDSDDSGATCFSSEKPRPWRIADARACAVDASRDSNCCAMLANSAWAATAAAGSKDSKLAESSRSRAPSAASSASAPSTASTTRTPSAPGATSWRTCKTRRWRGNLGRSKAAMWRSNVVFPTPFGPTRP